MTPGGEIKVRDARPLPAEQLAALARARRLCWWSLLLLSGTTVMMYLSMGGSQAMKTALVEDVLSLMPPLAFLVACWFQRKPIDVEYANGRSRAFDVNFLIASVALTGVGVALVWDSAHTLLTRTHPVIQTVEIGGALVWQGWVMIAALVVSSIPPVLLGRAKMRLARTLSLKPLHTDADTNKADWMTALAGIAGIVGIGYGLWWADAAAALFIAVSVLKDGISNLRAAVRDMHDARPQEVDRGDADPITRDVRDAVAALDWVASCRVRLHEEGFYVCGAIFIQPVGEGVAAGQLRAAHEAARAVHWRVDEIVVTLEGEESADAGTDG
ncbi:MAG TPA: cation transporter [Luteimonas sp.]|nr:cation transporter [Luteimonas sp.]